MAYIYTKSGSLSGVGKSSTFYTSVLGYQVMLDKCIITELRLV
jgi:hypothetical protein